MDTKSVKPGAQRQLHPAIRPVAALKIPASREASSLSEPGSASTSGKSDYPSSVIRLTRDLSKQTVVHDKKSYVPREPIEPNAAYVTARRGYKRKDETPIGSPDNYSSAP